MRERLKQYIERLFAHAPSTQSARELKEEMLQNLLDKYDDLIREGKSEEAAYEQAITGIGDVSGLIAGLAPLPDYTRTAPPEPKQKNAAVLSVAIAMYVLSVIPNFLFGNRFGVVLMFALIASATGMLIINRTLVHPARAALVGAGVALLIMSPAAPILINHVLGVVLLFVLLGAGVGLIVYGRTSQFDTVPAETMETAPGEKAALPRATKYGYMALGAIVLAFLIGAAVSNTVWHEPITVYDLAGNAIVGADGATDTAIGEDFGESIEDAIDERLDDNMGDSIESAVESALEKPGNHGDNDRDEHDDEDNDKDGKLGKKTAAAASIMEGATEVPAAGITEIEIDWVGGSVNVAPYSGSTIAISETSAQQLTDKQKLRYTVKGNKLSITYCEETLFVWDWLDIDRLSMPKKALTVQLPAGALPEVEINGVSADIEVRAIAADEIDVESVSGRVQVADVSCRKLAVQTTSGKCVVTGADVTKLSVESTSGAIDVTGSRADEVDVETVSARAELALVVAPRKFEVETVSGDTTLVLPKDATDFSVELESVSGGFSCEGIPGEWQGGRFVAGSGAYRYESTSVSGNFSIVGK